MASTNISETDQGIHAVLYADPSRDCFLPSLYARMNDLISCCQPTHESSEKHDCPPPNQCDQTIQKNPVPCISNGQGNVLPILCGPCRGQDEDGQPSWLVSGLCGQAKRKTLDPVRIAKWQGEEWESKLEGFRDLFRRNAAFVKNKTNAVCLGARTGQEVCALRESGIEAIGIDLVAFPPYTVEGDIHDLGFSEGEFDLVFTNSFDHALYPAKFVSEMERVCQTGGHIIVNLQIKMPVDDYSENIIHDPGPVSELFVNSTVVEAREIHNTFDGMNYEFVFKKRG